MVLEHPCPGKYLGEKLSRSGRNRQIPGKKKRNEYCCAKSTKGGWRSLLSSGCHCAKAEHQPVGVWSG